MATYPYVSGAGALVSAIERLRKNFPAVVTADTLKQLGIAPSNESFVINILRFVGIIDEDGKRVEVNTKAFFLSDDQFGPAFEEPVRAAYSPLFDLYGEDAWTRSRDDLSTFFRTADSTSDLVGKRQALTFLALASLSGHGEVAVPRTVSSPTARKRTSKQEPGIVESGDGKQSATIPVPVPTPALAPAGAAVSPVGLTVRVEVNLPATSDQAVYDAIFQSIRKNLIEGA